MIFLSVGTFIKGFDELVSAMDETCAQTGLVAFAQIGNSSVTPKHMQHERFLSTNEMQAKLQHAKLVVCHGGFGIIGDAMRAQKPIVAVPRQNPANSSSAPANNQLIVVRKLQLLHGISVCTELNQLPELVRDALKRHQGIQHYALHCNISNLITHFLENIR